MADKVTGKVFDRTIIWRLLGYLKPYRFQFFGVLMLTITLAILVPIRPALFQYILDNQVSQGDLSGLRLLVILVLGLLVVQTFLMYINTYWTNWLGQSVIKDIRNNVFRHILRLRLKFFDQTPIGVLQTRTINDVETLNEVFSAGLVRITGELLQLFAILGFMLYTNWRLTLVVLISLPVSLLATYIFKTKVKVAFQGVRKAISEMNAFIQEHLTGMQIVHIFSREEEELKRFNQINERLRGANLKSVLYYSVFFPVVEIISALALALLVWYGAGKVLEGTISFGVLVAFIMYLSMFFRPIRLIADQFNVLQMGMVSAERIFKLIDTNEVIPEPEIADKPYFEENEAVAISFKGINFAYNEPEWVLQDINLDVKPGEKVALVGSTGSGKSTIINLLSRFYEIQAGHIEINGTDIAKLKLHDLRSLIGVVLQDVFLFSGSIHDNITLNNDTIDRKAIEAAAKYVGAHDFISQLPGGYDYEVQERGATLSLGQRQLIAFARVMAFDPRVLILDEATANIDTESEEIIQQAIESILTGRTSIIIAHRLSTIQKADKIVVLGKGRILESGTHSELLQLKGAYFKLHQLEHAVS